MNRKGIAVVLVSLVAGAALGPAVAAAQQFRGGMATGSGFKGGPPRSHAIRPHTFGSRPLSARPFGFNPPPSVQPFHRRHFKSFGFGYFGAIGAPYVVYAPPYSFYGAAAYDPQPVYYPPPVYYSDPLVSAPAMTRTVALAPAPPSAPPAPTVVEFPTGRYELRGDGLQTPYTWVWIPNPPSAPPPSSAPPEGPPSSGRRPQLYRWTDEQGVLHLTDRLDNVPEQYRTQPKRPS